MARNKRKSMSKTVRTKMTSKLYGLEILTRGYEKATLKQRRVSEQDIIVITQGRKRRLDTGHARHGKMKLLREYISELLKEDPMAFVQDLAGPEAEDFYGGKVDKVRGREIKRAFEKHADHQWLSTIDTVHWTMEAYGLKNLAGRGKDELSTTMALPGDPLRSVMAHPFGLWVKGRITLASDSQDKLYSGRQSDYSAPIEGTEEEVAHRDKSSGRNKRPTMSKTYKQYANLEPGNEYAEKMARNIPYVLDQSTWNPDSPSSTNEALVDNWNAVGVVVASDEMVRFVKHYAENDPTQAVGAMKELFKAATDFGVPLYDINRTKLWSPQPK